MANRFPACPVCCCALPRKHHLLSIHRAGAWVAIRLIFRERGSKLLDAMRRGARPYPVSTFLDTPEHLVCADYAMQSTPCRLTVEVRVHVPVMLELFAFARSVDRDQHEYSVEMRVKV